ncbi:PepSY domain-containing protein [Altererythrobacter rubellus]|uniref:PepSY domain-containing protein n=1 Tax=Altererythrobacter rubellus TaxID=2173831 RepID=A0A9Y2B9W9_9SPHN|nr:PepSY domain-containing protein [Altererythrobacter rubellus]WIW96591.1 PepSY domain-containing protein [Altererythrobacter rubellus]
MPKLTMLKFARWHIWLGWLVGFPTLMWMVTGLYMAAKPIEEVRGNHLRVEQAVQPLVLPGSALASAEFPIREMRAVMQDGRAVAILTGMDGSTRRVDIQSGAALPALSANDARLIVAEQIKGGDQIRSVTAFDADNVPFDFRREMPVWQVALEDGAHIYIGRDTGQIEAVRTRWWRGFDFMWGLHIMDLRTREDTSHPILILFAALGVIGALLGCILMFRRRKAKVSAA